MRKKGNAAPLARPRILHLHESFDGNEAALRSVQIINAFGPKVEHAVVSGNSAISAASRIDHAIPVIFSSSFPKLKGSKLPGRLKKLAEAMKGYDLVLTYGQGAMDAVLAHTLFVQALGLPPLVHHEIGTAKGDLAAGGGNWLRRIAFGRTAAIIVSDPQVEVVALDAWQQPRSRVHRISGGIRTGDYARKPRPDVLTSLVKHKGEFWLGVISPLEKHVNLFPLISAVSGLGSPWQLVIIGEGSERDALLDEAERLELDHRVHLPGDVARHQDVMGLFDIFVQPEEIDGFPWLVVEAMAAGLPVVGPDSPAIAETVSKENAPYLKPLRDESGTGVAILDLASNDLLRGAIGKANRARAKDRFDEKSTIDRQRAIYSALIGRGKL